ASLATLPKNLDWLDLEGSQAVSSFAGIGSASEVNVSRTSILDFRDAPDSLRTLRFEFCSTVALKKFPRSLEKLYLGGCTDLDSIEHLPDDLKELYLQGTAIAALDHIPPKLKVLDISNTNILKKLPRLPTELEELVLHAGQVETLQGLPRAVKRLRFVLHTAKH